MLHLEQLLELYSLLKVLTCYPHSEERPMECGLLAEGLHLWNRVVPGLRSKRLLSGCCVTLLSTVSKSALGKS